MSRLGYVVTLGSLSALSAAAINISVPAQPDIARYFGAPSSSGAMVVGGYFWGFALSHLIWGPLSDRFGRIWPLTVAMLGFIAASCGCALAESFDMLIVGRVIQGIFGGAGATISRAIARDEGGGTTSASLLTTMAIILGGAPLVAPPLGSGLIALFDWRSTYWFLALFAASLLVAQAVFLRHADRARQASGAPSFELRLLRPILGHKDFIVATVLSSAMSLGFATFIASSSDVAQQRYGISAEKFGPLFALVAVAYVIGSFYAKRKVLRWGTEKMILVGCVIAAAGGAGLAAGAWSALPFWALWLFAAAFAFGYGMLFPATMAKALEPAGSAAGSAAAVLGLSTVVLAAIGAALVTSRLFADSYQGLCLIVAAASFLCLAVQLATMPRRQT